MASSLPTATYCNICQKGPFGGPIPARAHFESRTHKEKENVFLNPKRQNFCEICNVACNDVIQYQQHIASPRHLAAEAKSETTRLKVGAQPPDPSNVSGLPNCNACGNVFPNSRAADDHFASEMHKKKVSLSMGSMFSNGCSNESLSSTIGSSYANSFTSNRAEASFIPQGNLVTVNPSTNNESECSSVEMNRLFQNTVEDIKNELGQPLSVKESRHAYAVSGNCQSSSEVKKEYSFHNNRGYCNACNIELTSGAHASQHLNGQKHLKNKQKWIENQSLCHAAKVSPDVQESNSPRSDKEFDFYTTTKTGYCYACKIDLTSEVFAMQHLNGPNHQKNKHKWIENQSSGTSAQITGDNQEPPDKEYYLSSATNTGHCYVCEIDLTSEAHALQHLNGQKHQKNKQKWVEKLSSPTQSKVTNNNLVTESQTTDQEYRFNASTNTGHCCICDIELTSKQHAQQHLSGKNHAKARQRKNSNFQDKSSLNLFCEVCQKGFSGPESAAQHYASEKHKSKEQIAKQFPALDTQISSALPATGHKENIDKTEWYVCTVCKCKMNSAEQLEIHNASPKHKVEEEKRARDNRPIDIVKSAPSPEYMVRKNQPLEIVCSEPRAEAESKMSINLHSDVPLMNQFQNQILGEFELVDLGLSKSSLCNPNPYDSLDIPSGPDLSLSSFRYDHLIMNTNSVVLPKTVQIEADDDTVPKHSYISSDTTISRQSNKEFPINSTVREKKLPEKLPVDDILLETQNNKNNLNNDDMPDLEPIDSKSLKNQKNIIRQHASSESSSGQSSNSDTRGSFGLQNDHSGQARNILGHSGPQEVNTVRAPGAYPYNNNSTEGMERDPKSCSQSTGQNNKVRNDISRALKNRPKRTPRKGCTETELSDSDDEENDLGPQVDTTRQKSESEFTHSTQNASQTQMSSPAGPVPSTICNPINPHSTSVQHNVSTTSSSSSLRDANAASLVNTRNANISNLPHRSCSPTVKTSVAQSDTPSNIATKSPFPFHSFYCEICNRPMNTRKAYDDHMRGKSHMQKVATREVAKDRSHKPQVKEFHNYVDLCPDLTNTRPRDYQKELFAKAMEGDAVIFLPTGTGKTLISCMVVSAMLQQNPTRQVVFLVDKVLLVLQQSQYLIKEIGSRNYDRFDPNDPSKVTERKLKIAALCGGQQTTDGLPLWKHDLIIVTAAFYENLISKGILRWSDLSLVVLDEAHHCTKHHPYNMLLQKHHIEMNMRERPKILGLTASPAGKGTVSMTTTMLQALMGYMGDSRMIIVEKNTTQLKRFQSNAELVVNNIQLGQKENDLCLELQLHLLNCYMRLCDETDILSRWNFGLKANQRKRNLSDQEKIECAQELTGDVLNSLEVTIDKVYPNTDNVDKRFFVRNLTTHIKFICMSLNSLCEAGVPAALDDLQTLMTDESCNFDFAESFELHCEKLLSVIQTCFDIEGAPMKTKPSPVEMSVDMSPHVTGLIKILTNPSMIDWNQKDEKPMVLVLVKERSTAFSMYKSLKSHKDIVDRKLSIVVVVGHGAGSSGGGMKVNQQKRVLEEVKGHQHDVIVATAVAEEGIDIPECQLVISMNPPTTVRAMVQMRGRARKANSKFVVVCSDESEHSKLEELKKKEENMIKATNLLVQCQNGQTFQR